MNEEKFYDMLKNVFIGFIILLIVLLPRFCFKVKKEDYDEIENLYRDVKKKKKKEE